MFPLIEFIDKSQRKIQIILGKDSTFYMEKQQMFRMTTVNI